MEDQELWLRKKPRKLSRFLCEEMLYDFVSDRLDKERRQAVQEFIESDEGAREELANVESGLHYLQELRRTKVSDEFVLHLATGHSQMTPVRSLWHWKTWPATVRIAVDAVALSSVITVAIVIFAWKRIQVLEHKPKNFAMVQVPHQQTLPQKVQAPAPTESAATLPAATKPVVIKPAVTKPTVTKVVAKSNAVAVNSEPDNPWKIPLSHMPQSVVLTAGAVSVPLSVTQAQPEGMPAFFAKGERGIVYKVFIHQEKFHRDTKPVAQVITTLGGRRAGEVPLGWIREHGSYFHFTLPVGNYGQLVSQLQSFGPVQIFREPNPKVMPTGTIRFILWMYRH